MEKKSILFNTGEWDGFLLSILNLFLHLVPWKFSLVMQKGGENATISSGYIESAKSPSSVPGSVLTHIYVRKVPEPCSVGDDLNSLKLRAFVTTTYFNMMDNSIIDAAIIAAASILPLLSPFTFCSLKFPATTPKPCCGQGKLFPAGRSCDGAHATRQI